MALDLRLWGRDQPQPGFLSSLGTVKSFIMNVGAGAVLTLGSIPAVAGAIGKGLMTLVPKTIKGKLIAGVGSLVAGGALLGSKKLRQDVVKAPGSLVDIGKKLGGIYEEPSWDKLKSLVKEHPTASLLAAGGAIVGAGAIAAPLISGALTRAEMRKQTEAFERSALAAETGGVLPVAGAAGGAGATSPVLPVTTSMSTPRRRRKAKKAVIPSMRQSIKINIKNASTGVRLSKRYLNAKIYA